MLRVPQRWRNGAAKGVEYERRRKMPSEEMANRMDNNAIPAAMEFIKWRHTYDVLKFFFAKTPMTGTLGTTANMSALGGNAVFPCADLGTPYGTDGNRLPNGRSRWAAYRQSHRSWSSRSTRKVRMRRSALCKAWPVLISNSH